MTTHSLTLTAGAVGALGILTVALHHGWAWYCLHRITTRSRRRNVLLVSGAITFPDGHHTLAIVALAYTKADPFAVRYVIHAEDLLHRGAFARELLATGLDHPAGDGTVRITPDARRRDQTRVSIDTRRGTVVLTLPRRRIQQALRRWHQMVPPGTEGGLLDFDAGLRRMLDHEIA